jgi:arylsulfatase
MSGRPARELRLDRKGAIRLARQLVVGLAGIALAVSCTGGAREGPARRVFLITCDTLRADRLGVYGYDRPVSPGLDAFARGAVVFDHAYSTSSQTGPALSSLLTSRLPDEIGVGAGNLSLMPEQVTTLPEVLSEAGIPTAAVVSNWMLRRPAAGQGDVGVQQGFVHFDDAMTTREPNRDAYERRATATTDAALEWLRAAQFDGPVSEEPLLELGRTNKGRGQIPAYQALGDERHPQVYRNRYDAEIHYFDREVGRLLSWIEREGYGREALILFTADHGESLGEHDYWFSHGESLYRELVRVPFILRFPEKATPPRAARTGPHRRIGTLVSHLDVSPTVLDAFGLPPRPGRGVSLLAGEIPEGRLVCQTLGVVGGPKRWLGITTRHNRLVVRPGGRPLLYDIDQDAAEEHDLSSVDPALVGELMDHYRSFLDGLRPDGPIGGVELRMDEEARRALRALGYVD